KKRLPGSDRRTSPAVRSRQEKQERLRRSWRETSALIRHAAIYPMAASAERGQDLIADRAGVGGCRVDAVIVVEQLDEAARLREQRIGGSHVKHDEIH